MTLKLLKSSNLSLIDDSLNITEHSPIQVVFLRNKVSVGL
jgi:hypothetical protein